MPDDLNSSIFQESFQFGREFAILKLPERWNVLDSREVASEP